MTKSTFNKKDYEFFAEILIEMVKDDLIKQVCNSNHFPYKVSRGEAIIILAKIGKLCNDELIKLRDEKSN